MKLSCLPVSYFSVIQQGRMTIGQWAEQAAALGLDAVDLSIIFFGKNRDRDLLLEMRRKIETHKIHVSVLNTYTDFTHPDPIVRKDQQHQLQQDLDVALQIGAQMVRITAGQAHPQTSRKQGIKWVVEGLKRAGEIALNCGVKAVFENHSQPGVWYYPDFCLPSDIFLEIADKIKDTSLGILFDTANPLVYRDDPIVILENIQDRLQCIHAADIRRRGVLEPVVIGSGIVPFPKIFSILHRLGYDGNISIEEASGCGPQGVAAAVNYIRTAWDETRKKLMSV